MQDPLHFGTGVQPFRQPQAVLVMTDHTRAEAANPAHGQIAIVRPGAVAQVVGLTFDLLVQVGGNRNGPQHGVGMADDVLGRGLNRNVDAVLERLEIESGAPGVVHDHLRAAGMGGLDDRRDVLHLEGLRTGRLDEHDPGLGTHQVGDPGADLRIEIGRLDAEAFEKGIAEPAGRKVDTVGDQHVVARSQERQHRGGDGRQPGRQDHGTFAAFKRGNRLFERERRRRALTAVVEELERFVARGFQFGDRRKGYGRSVVNRWINDPEILFGPPACVDQGGVLFH